MKKPFNKLYASLEKDLGNLAVKCHGHEMYGQGIRLIRDTIMQLQDLAPEFMRQPGGQVEYFREIWPVFYAKLLLYILLNQFELHKIGRPERDLDRLIRKEDRRVADFFRTNREFWMYYRSGVDHLNEQFTRIYSQSSVFDPLSLLIDQEGATLASYRAAWCLAMEHYRMWLSLEWEKRTGSSSAAGQQGDYTWNLSDADFVEWLYGLQAVGAIKYKDNAADISRLMKWAKWALTKEVVNIYDRFKVLRNRKIERMPFTKRIANALEKRMDEADGKFK